MKKANSRTQNQQPFVITDTKLNQLEKKLGSVFLGYFSYVNKGKEVV